MREREILILLSSLGPRRDLHLLRWSNNRESEIFQKGKLRGWKAINSSSLATVSTEFEK